MAILSLDQDVANKRGKINIGAPIVAKFLNSYTLPTTSSMNASLRFSY